MWIWLLNNSQMILIWLFSNYISSTKIFNNEWPLAADNAGLDPGLWLAD